MSEQTPIPMLIWCPKCGERHIDVGEFATRIHSTHSCQACGLPWRPALVPTVGVEFLPGYKNAAPVAVPPKTSPNNLLNRAIDALTAGRACFGQHENDWTESDLRSLVQELQEAAQGPMSESGLTDEEKLMSGEEYLTYVAEKLRRSGIGMRKMERPETSKSILQDWVQELGLRHQGILVSAVRGCDTAPKDSGAKSLSRYFRSAVLNAHCGDPLKSKSFIEVPSEESFKHAEGLFFHEWDALPFHYVMHLAHAAEIIGYTRPVLSQAGARLDHHPHDYRIAACWLAFYRRICKKMHVPTESKEELDARLNKNEEAFAADQKQ